MTEKPLNVRVAEALGCTTRWAPAVGFRALLPGAGDWICLCPPVDGGFFGPHVGGPDGHIRPYGEDSPEGWACTGPLIERFDITIGRYASWAHGGRCFAVWPGLSVSDRGVSREERTGVSRPDAACNLILALAEAGRLPR